MFVTLYYDRTIFCPMKNISRTSKLPMRSCENRRFPLKSCYGFTWIMSPRMYAWRSFQSSEQQTTSFHKNDRKCTEWYQKAHVMWWNCQGLRPKRKELQNYLLENQIDILALNETFLKLKIKFHVPGYDIYKNDRLVGTKSGAAILVKKGIIVNQDGKMIISMWQPTMRLLQLKSNSKMGIRLFWLSFTAQMEILV